jgi:hypothetical protein
VAGGGWLKLYRELIEKPIWKCTTPEQKAILITLLCMANHEEQEWIWQGKKYKCKPGQFITSLKSIAEKSGTSIKNVRTALKNFEQIYEFSASISTNKNRLITITNWELYQSKEGKVASRTASKRQATGKQVATNKNDKNDKNDKNNKNNIFIPPTLEEVTSYCKERNNSVDPQKWYDFYAAKGWMIGKNKMKDWKAAVRTWERRDSEKNTQDFAKKYDYDGDDTL